MFIKVTHRRIYDAQMEQDIEKVQLENVFFTFTYDPIEQKRQELSQFVKELDKKDMHIRCDAVDMFYRLKRPNALVICFNNIEYLVEEKDEKKFYDWLESNNKKI